MESLEFKSQHDRIQKEIMNACRTLGIHAVQEYKGLDWRADVFIPKENPVAFEVQLSPQSLTRTLERQTKYIRDGIVGCWFFEKPLYRFNEELEQLPVFYVEYDQDSKLWVHLKDRRKVDIAHFIDHFSNGGIQFKTSANTMKKQIVKLVFHTMCCWKCGTLNYIYFVDSPFYSSCHAAIKPYEAMWESNKLEYRPEIEKLARHFINSHPELKLNLGEIKHRHSKTTNTSYLSFGCYHCDSIFGDYFVMEAKMEEMYNDENIRFEGSIILEEEFKIHINHWCMPEDGKFCS